MANPSAEEFIAALRRVEEDGDVEAMAALYAGEAELRTSSEQATLTGPDGARHFWTAYRHSFEHVRSRFHAVLEGEQRVMLEWTSDCRTAAGVDTRYGGVSVVETRDGRIVRFQAYFDPAQLHAAPALQTGLHAAGRAQPADRGATQGRDARPSR